MTATVDPTPLVVVGETFSQEHQLTPEAVSAFASMIGDSNPLHHDAEFAARSRFGTLIASGTHTGALLMGLTASHFSKRAPVVGVGFTLKFRKAVPAAAHVTLQWTVTAVTPHRGGNGELVDLAGALSLTGGPECLTATGQVLVGFELAKKA